MSQDFGWNFNGYTVTYPLPELYVMRHILDYVVPQFEFLFKTYFRDSLELLGSDYYNIACVINGQRYEFLEKRTFELQ